MLLFFKKLGVIIIALFALALSGCSGKTDGGSYVVSIDGSQVSVNEYMIYLRETVKSFEAIGGEDIWETDFDGRNAFDVARENAMNSLVMVKLSVAQAEKSGLELSDSEKSEAQKEAEDYIAEYNDSSDKDVIERVMEEKLLYEKLKEQILSEYSVSESEFESYYEKNYDYYKQSLADINYSKIYSQSYDTAEEIRRRAAEGEGFSALISEYQSEMNVQNGEASVNLNEVLHDDISNISAGSLSSVQKDGNGYAVYRVNSITYMSDDEIRKTAHDEFERATKERVFNDMVSSWRNGVSININTDELNKITEIY